MNKLGLDLINVGGLVDSALYKCSEAAVITDLLVPLLKRIAHVASMALTAGKVPSPALLHHCRYRGKKT